MIKYGVLPLNVIVGMLYLAAVAVALVALKMANRPLRRFHLKQKNNSQNEG